MQGPDGTGTCKCNAGYFLDNCSGSQKMLAWNEPQSEGALQGTTSYWQMGATELADVDHLGDFSIVIHVDEVRFRVVRARTG